VKYTHHSQYLKDITLTGTNDSNIIINQLDNNITGNTGVNTVTFSGLLLNTPSLKKMTW